MVEESEIWFYNQLDYSNMILPYFNTLLITHKYNQLELDDPAEETIKDYLEEYFRKFTKAKIAISSLSNKNSQIIARTKNILHMLITNLSLPVYEINDSYTL